MKQLTEEQVDYVKQDIKNKGVYSAALLNELTDHICSMIEEKGFEGPGFFEVYKRVVDEFGPSNFRLIQELTNKMVNNKKNNEMKTIKLIMVLLMAYATFVMLLSLFPEFNNNASVDALRMTGFMIFATTLLLLSFFLIRFRIKNIHLKFITGLLGYLSSFVLMVLGLREINFEAGNSLLKIMPYLLIGIVSSCGILLYRFRKNLHKTVS